MNLTISEEDLIKFLYNHKKECDNSDYLKSIKGNYKLMFEATRDYHDDERLTKQERKTINTLYTKFKNELYRKNNL